MLATLPPSVWAGLLLTPATIAGGQVLFKLASARLDQVSPEGFARLFLDPMFVVAVVIYGLATFIWVYVLRSVPLSIAYSFMSVTYILVPVLSAIFLGEGLTFRSLAGATLIIAGLLVVTG